MSHIIIDPDYLTKLQVLDTAVRELNTQKIRLIFAAVGITTTDADYRKDSPEEQSYHHELKKYAVALTSGVVLNINRFSMSFSQNWISPLMQDLYKQEVGNITLYFNW